MIFDLFGEDAHITLLKKINSSIITKKYTFADFTFWENILKCDIIISANSFGINDGLNYVDDCMDVAQCRETFEMIFKYMEQGEHYKMMIEVGD